jgi:apolipoprotein D and lipocalin family protein
MTMRFKPLFAAWALACAAIFAHANEPLTAVPALDVPRYMGTWYEIAKLPNSFQRKCVGSTRAQYSLQADGRVQVANSCRLASGEFSDALGTARQVGAANSPKLKVRFAPAWLSLIPMVWGDYWVVELDDNYQWVAVSEPGREYLWILSRTPRMDPVVYTDLLMRLTRKGLDLRKLELTRQDD